jgi:GDP-L-fucose synthase
MCQSYNKQYDTNFISVMPTNLYGYNDNYDLENSHVLPAIRKFHEKKIDKTDVNLWEQEF